MTYRIVRFLFKLGFQALFALLGGVRVEGREWTPRQGGLVVAPNHSSHADPPLVGVTLPRTAWFVATTDLFRLPILGRVARWLHAFPIRQDSPDRAALRRCEELLRSGNAVIMFPEGHESIDGSLQPLQGGPVLVAIRAGCPIQPVAILGSADMARPQSFRIRRARRPVLVRYGRPISAAELAGGLTGRAAVDHGTRLLRAALLSLQAPHAEKPPSIALAPAPVEPLS